MRPQVTATDSGSASVVLTATDAAGEADTILHHWSLISMMLRR